VEEGDLQVSRTFRAHPAALHEIRSFVRDQAEGGGFRSSVVDDLVLAVSEACANAIVHTNTPMVDVRCSLSTQLLSIEVKDKGIFRRRVAMPEIDGHGRGIPLMAALVDELTIKEGTPERPGTLVRLVKYRIDALRARVG
jgi:anti-sigma regulatory factor (Ser/Thr protein kinase)